MRIRNWFLTIGILNLLVVFPSLICIKQEMSSSTTIIWLHTNGTLQTSSFIWLPIKWERANNQWYHTPLTSVYASLGSGGEEGGLGETSALSYCTCAIGKRYITDFSPSTLLQTLLHAMPICYELKPESLYPIHSITTDSMMIGLVSQLTQQMLSLMGRQLWSFIRW